MKTPVQHLSHNLSIFATLAAAAICFSVTTPAHAVNYAGNGGTSFGGDIGNGVLTLTDNGTNISGSLTVGNGNSMYNTLVLYIDTGEAGGFTSTTNFNDQQDSLRIGISGVSGSGRSALTFTNGFTPKYAVALGPNNASFGGIWQLASGGNNSLNYVTSASLNPVGTSSGPFTFSIPATAIGLTNGTQKTIKIFGTYISNSGFRSTEAIAGNDFGAFGQGWNPFTQTAFANYTFAQAVVPTYSVTFKVDMTAQVVSGAFHPGAGDTVYCGGSFQTNPFAFGDFPLTPSAGNTNIYTGTYLDSNPTNTVEQYKFKFISVVNSTTNYDDDPNRPFTLKGGGQVLPVVYFNNLAAVPSATTNSMSFRIDLGPQIYLGQFNPATNQIEIIGSFQNPKFADGFFLTNNPSVSTSNIYSGTFVDGNYPGTVHGYKYVMVSGATKIYESGGDRTLTTPTNAATFPLAYFNGVSNIYSTPITFSVDMTVPLLTHLLTPGAGDTVGCAGTFQTNSFTVGNGGFLLTNNPSAANSNVYSGTYIDRNQPGAPERYKFVINTNGGASTIYESPASTGGGDRQFLLGSVAATNPLVFWNDYNASEVLPVDTTVKFTVNMNNSIDVFGNPYDPANDLVFVDGDFAPSQFRVMSHYNDPLINSDYPANLMTETNAGSQIFICSFVVPAGNPLKVVYKYGIYHNSSALNTNVDNEAGFAVNHTRYIRSAGTYNFPSDIFGQQRTNLPAATETEFGNLAIGRPAAGRVPITWLGLPSVHLQTRTNLVNGVWQDQNATAGLNSTNWPAGGSSQFFRLVKP